MYFRIAFQVNNIVETFQRDEFTATLESRLGTFPVVFESRECAATHKVQIGKSRSFEALAHDGQVLETEFFLGEVHELHAHVAGFDGKEFYFGHHDGQRENRTTCTRTHIGPAFRRENARRLATDERRKRIRIILSSLVSHLSSNIYIGNKRIGNVPAQKLFGILRRNQVAKLLGLYDQVRKIIKLAQNIFGQLHTMFRQELVQEILLIFVFSVTHII